jgi:hypothetical protein
MKKKIKHAIDMAPGGMNKGLIWKMFANIMIPLIGPSITSRLTMANVSSKIPRSLEKLFKSFPVGVTSK